MTRASIKIALALVVLNASVTVISASGLGAAIGYNPGPSGVQERISSTEEQLEAKKNDATGGLGSTLFAVYRWGAQTFNIITSLVTAAPTFFINIGAPDWLVAFIFSPLYLIVAVDFTFIFTGRDL